MARSTGPILALTGLTIANETLWNDRPLDMRLPVAGAVLVGLFAAGEKLAPDVMPGLAWLALITSLIVPRPKAGLPSPAESITRSLGYRR